MPEGDAGARTFSKDAHSTRDYTVGDDGRVTSAAVNMLGPMAEIGAFQRSRVRRTAVAIGAMTAVCIALVLVSVAMNGVEAAFGPDTPVRLPILALIAAMFLTPIVWSAVFRSHRYGMTLTRDALIVVARGDRLGTPRMSKLDCRAEVSEPEGR